MRNLLVAAVALTFAVPTVGHPQATPNLAGTWRFDEVKSAIGNDGPAGFVATELVIKHSPTDVTVESDTGPGHRLVTSVYKLDGSENIVPGPPNWVTKAKAAWVGAQLVVTFKLVFQGPTGDINIETKFEPRIEYHSSDAFPKERAQMKRLVSVAVFALVAVPPLLAQAPKGWRMRVDRSTSASDPDAAGAIKFVAIGSGFHAITPQAAVFWNPASTVSGNYSLKGTFTLMRPSPHVNYYGFVFGASDLEGPGQSYLYFMVAQDGTWLLKRRVGNATGDVSPRMRTDAVKKPDATGKSINALEVRVMADKIEYVVNGTIVHTTPRSGATAKTDGIYGIRVNHLLDVQVDGFAVSKL